MDEGAESATTFHACFRRTCNLTKNDLPLEGSKHYQTEVDINISFARPVSNDTIFNFENVVKADAEADLLDYLPDCQDASVRKVQESEPYWHISR